MSLAFCSQREHGKEWLSGLLEATLLITNGAKISTHRVWKAGICLK